MKRHDLKSLKQNPSALREAVAGIDPNTIAQVKKTMQQFNGKDKTQLMDELQVMAARERANGNLSNAQVDTIANAIGSMLDPEGRQQLNTIVQQLKQM